MIASAKPLVPALVLLALTGCGGGPADVAHGKPHGRPVAVANPYAGPGPIKVVCTVAMVADTVRAVGGGRIEVTTLLGEGTDPHQYKASPGDIRLLTDADAIFWSGLHLEGKMGDVLAKLGRRKPSVAVCEHLAAEKLLADGETFDPHVWFDVSLWAETADVVRDALVAFDPPHADEYVARAKAYRDDLAKLHAEVTSRLAEIPKERRVMVTAHDAFRYFGRAYDVEVRGIQGISTESEAGVGDVNGLVDFLVTRKIKAVFVESSVAERNVRALVEGCKARGHVVAVGGELFSDAMGKPGTPEGAYAGMVRHNVEVIVKALR